MFLNLIRMIFGFRQVNLIDHPKIYDPAFPSNILPMSQLSVITPSSQTESITLSHSLPNSSELVTGRFFQFGEFLIIVFFFRSDPSVSIDTNASAPKYFTNLSYIDDNLTDEDAWMSILDVVNAEVRSLLFSLIELHLPLFLACCTR